MDIRAAAFNKSEDDKFHAALPVFPNVNPLEADYWPWFWEHFGRLRKAGIEKRILPPREIE